MVRSLRITATRATFFGLPAATSRRSKARRTGLYRLATRAAMERPARTTARPPQVVRRPRQRPLSRLSGATPASAAISWRLSCPNSGRCAISIRARCGADPRPPVKQTGLLPPDRRGRDARGELLLERRKLPLQPADVRAHRSPQRGARDGQPGAFGAEHLE